MINVAIVEDEEQQAQALAECVGRYGREHGSEFSCVVYANAINFLQNYRARQTSCSWISACRT